MKLRNVTELTSDLGLKSTWLVGAVKKVAPEIFVAGRYSTVAQIRRWLRAHPQFVAAHVLRTPEQREKRARSLARRRRQVRAIRAPLSASERAALSGDSNHV